MKNFPLFILAALLSKLCFSQDYSFRLTINTNNTLKPQVDSVSPEFFKTATANLKQTVDLNFVPKRKIDNNDNSDKTKSAKIQKHFDSLITALKKKYPNTINIKDSCMILNGIDSQLTLCNNMSENANNDWSFYQIKDYQKGFLILYHEIFESWEYVLFNPKTRAYTFIADSPYFMNDSIIFSSGNYYREGQFQLLSLKKDNSFFSFTNESWELLECYREDKIFYLLFKSNKPESKMRKYIKMDFNNEF